MPASRTGPRQLRQGACPGAQSPTVPDVQSRCGGDKYANGASQEIFQISLTVLNTLGQVLTSLKLQTAVGLVVIVAVKHRFVAPFAYALPQVVDERAILMKGMNRPSAAIFFRDTFARAGPVEWNHRE